MDGIQCFFFVLTYTLLLHLTHTITNPLLRSIESGSSFISAQISPTVLSILKGVHVCVCEHKTNFSSLRLLLLLHITLTSVTITFK